MSGGDDDETTSTRANKLRSPILPAETAQTAPQRPTIPLIGRGSKSRSSQQADDFEERPDDAPTMFDPNVPTGARIQTEDERRTNQAPAQPDPFPDLDDSELPSGATVVGKRSAVPGGTPKPKRPPMKSDVAIRSGSAGLDDSTRTKRWEPAQVAQDVEPTGPALRPPPAPAPLPQVAAPQLPLPPVMPLAPGPRSEPIHVMSMKTPAPADEDRQQRAVPEVRMRPLAEVRHAQNQTPPQGMGFLAPPRDPREARSRRRVDYIIWGSVAVIVAAVVMLAVWFLAR